MPDNGPVLHMFCGKIAAGKSTLAARLAEAPGTVLVSEDIWLHGLYADQMSTLRDFVEYSGRLRSVLAPHLSHLLDAGVSVVLDAQANTVASRRWMMGIVREAKVSHQLHLLDPPDDVCLERLRARNAAGTHAFAATEEQFYQTAKYFEPPLADEGLNIVRYDGSAQ